MPRVDQKDREQALVAIKTIKSKRAGREYKDAVNKLWTIAQKYSKSPISSTAHALGVLDMKENKMKKADLRRIIKEEIRKILKESTNADIAIEDPSGKVRSVYLHYDGDRAGQLLKKYYSNKEKVKDLLFFGKNGISILDKEIGKKQDFRNPNKGWTVFYGRDRGETNSMLSRYNDREDLVKKHDSRYAYLYSMKDGKWYYNDYTQGRNWRPL